MDSYFLGSKRMLESYFIKIMDVTDKFNKNKIDSCQASIEMDIIYEEIGKNDHIIENLYEPFRQFMKFEHSVNYSVKDFVSIHLQKYIEYQKQLKNKSTIN